MLCYSSVKQAMEHIAKENIGKQTKSIHIAASYSTSEFPQLILGWQCNTDDCVCHHNTYLITQYIIPVFDGLDFGSCSQKLKVWP